MSRVGCDHGLRTGNGNFLSQECRLMPTKKAVSQTFPHFHARISWPLFALTFASTPMCLAQSAPARLVHQYLEVRLSPDAARVASVEGDSPVGGYYPEIRDLVIR